MARINDEDPQKLVYLDESGIDDTARYDYGWAPRGNRMFAMKPGKKKLRVNMIAALSNGKIIAPFTFEGNCDTEIFETYIEKILLPTLTKGQIIIMDNATFHKSKKVTELILHAGCELIFLPPYSPDFNPIEHCWFQIKHTVRKYLTHFKDANLNFAIDYVFNTLGTCNGF